VKTIIFRFVIINNVETNLHSHQCTDVTSASQTSFFLICDGIR